MFVIGAGFSQYTSGRDDFSGWGPLLAQGLERIRKRDTEWDLPEQEDWNWPSDFIVHTEKIYAKLSELGIFSDYLRETVGRLESKFEDVATALADSRLPLLTVNYDLLLEKLTGRSAIDAVDADIGRYLTAPSEHVLHLHGHWRTPEEIVPGGRISYDESFLHYHSDLQQWLSTRTLIFVGLASSLHLSPLTDLMSSGPRKHYLITREQDIDEIARSLPTEQRPTFVSCGTSFDNLSHFIQRLTEPKRASRLGQGLVLAREAGKKELALKVEDTGRAIADVLAGSYGELCFALYGPWGRGKTTLARAICAALERGETGLRYQDVWFNAWKYRGPAEVWAHLYESLAQGAHQGNPFVVLARKVRANVSRLGFFPLGLALLGLAVGLLPLALKLEVTFIVLSAITGFVGVLGMIWLLTAFRRTASVMKNVWRLYGSLPSHQDRLGLQATIGTDLHHLLRGWIWKPPTRSSQSHARLPLSVRATLPTWPGIILFVSLVIAIGFVYPIALTVVEDAPFRLDHGLAVTWWSSWALISLVMVLVGRRTRRILLVVEDLDRCLPSTMLEILESIKLLVEEDAISERLQVLVLVDDEMLVRAVAERFATYVDKAPEHRRASLRRRLVREHLDKLILCDFRLGMLSGRDVATLVQSYAGQPPGDENEKDEGADEPGEDAESTAGTTPPEETPRRSGPSDDDSAHAPDQAEPAGGPSDGVDSQTRALVLTNQERPLTDDAKHDARQPASRESRIARADSETTVEPDVELALSQEERMLLLTKCRRLLQQDAGDRLGPRVIRSIVLRYQLARRLLRGKSVTPEFIADRIVGAHLRDRSITLDPDQHSADQPEAIVAQVLGVDTSALDR